jgi:DNA-binding transcriptional LysR family regulator
MENWDEVRTAFHVARIGTVSGAAEVLGVHHATVIRHIDALERRLGTRLFQRHARGYTPTEAGRDLMSVAKTTEEQLVQLSSRIKGLGEMVTGELVVTSIPGIAGMLAPVFARYQAQHPEVVIRFLTDLRLFRLDYGEAHVAIRAGEAPQEPDYVAQQLVRVQAGMYASRAYVEAHGPLSDTTDYATHRFIDMDDHLARGPMSKWLRSTVPLSSIGFRISELGAMEAAIVAGLGIGFLPRRSASANPDLVEVMPALAEWQSPLWIVTHVDLHRTLKVQSFLAVLKSAAAEWNRC